jgi:predicted nuclease with TOPRIM domain
MYLLFALFLASAVGVLRAEESGAAAYMPMYLISESELRIIEDYKTKSEAEKQTWLSQVQRLNTQVASLQRESKTLNNQLASQRDQAQTLQISFDEYESESLMTISLKNGEIADLKQEVAAQTLETATYKGISRSRLIVIIALGSAWIIYIAFKICRFFKIF